MSPSLTSNYPTVNLNPNANDRTNIESLNNTSTAIVNNAGVSSITTNVSASNVAFTNNNTPTNETGDAMSTNLSRHFEVPVSDMKTLNLERHITHVPVTIGGLFHY